MEELRVWLRFAVIALAIVFCVPAACSTYQTSVKKDLIKAGADPRTIECAWLGGTGGVQYTYCLSVKSKEE